MKEVDITGKCVCGSTRFEFNLNNAIKFKPTELGHVIYKAHYMPYQRGDSALELKVDGEGYAKMQLWTFMEIFGPKFSCGFNVPVETSVIFINETAEQLKIIKQPKGNTHEH